MLWLLGFSAALAALVWTIGAREPVFAIARGGPIWFVAVKRNQQRPIDLAPSVSVRWAGESDFAFIGADEPYWTHFYILSGGIAEKPPLTLDAGVDDAFIARLRPLKPPALALGVLRVFVALGVLSRPEGVITADAHTLGHRAEVMPGARAIAALLARPASYAPAMVNFLRYYEAARYEGAQSGTGRAAYMRYGPVAMRTVYRTGGRLLFYGRVQQVLRAAAGGPCIGAWDDIAAMQYARPEGILSMEHAPDYRAALIHRDAGLDRTVVIASHPTSGGVP